MGNSGSRRPDNGYGPVHAMDAVPDLAWATTAARVLKWAAAAMVRATVRGRVTAVFMVMIRLMTAATARVSICAAPVAVWATARDRVDALMDQERTAPCAQE